MTADRLCTSDTAKHTERCNHALCPCYLEGMAAGLKPTGRVLHEVLSAAVSSMDQDQEPTP